MEVIQSKPIGFCYGVVQAINLAKKVRRDYPKHNIYVFGHLVHNEQVIEELEQMGIHTIKLDGIDPYEVLNRFTSKDIVIFTAHGHIRNYETVLENNHVRFIDATCSRVKKNQTLIDYYLHQGEVIYIGKKNHPEVQACLSLGKKVYLFDINEKFNYRQLQTSNPLIANQTTLSYLELEAIHHDIKEHLNDAIFVDEICDAARLRQTLIRDFIKPIDAIIIVGGHQSSNTQKLYEVAIQSHPKAKVYQVENLEELLNKDLTNVLTVLLASGTSTPINTVRQIKVYLGGINNA